MTKRPGGPLRERTPIKLANGPACETRVLFADIVNNMHNQTIVCTDEHGNEYEAYHFTIDVNRNLTANSWFQI
jgi:hypothetical protein